MPLWEMAQPETKNKTKKYLHRASTAILQNYNSPGSGACKRGTRCELICTIPPRKRAIITPELLCLHEASTGPAMRSCSQFDLLIMDRSQNSYNQSELGSRCRSTFSLSSAHAHARRNKSRPGLCSSGAIIICLVQLHLK